MSATTWALVKPMALSTPNSPVRSRTAWDMVLPVTSRMVKNTAPENGRDDQGDVADLAGPALEEGAFRLRFGFGVGVFKFLVHQFRHFRGLRRVFDADGVPADLPFGPALRASSK